MSNDLPTPKEPTGGLHRIAVIGAGYVGGPTMAVRNCQQRQSAQRRLLGDACAAGVS